MGPAWWNDTNDIGSDRDSDGDNTLHIHNKSRHVKNISDKDKKDQKEDMLLYDAQLSFTTETSCCNDLGNENSNSNSSIIVNKNMIMIRLIYK